jgi:hypothetical protein
MKSSLPLHKIHLIPLPPSPRREGGIYLIYIVLAPLFQERGWGEVKNVKGGSDDEFMSSKNDRGCARLKYKNLIF